MIDAAAIPRIHAAVVAAWRPFVTETRAQSEADSFICRVFSANDNRLDTYEDVLSRIAAVVADQSPDWAVRIRAAAAREI
jgi:hypothetical protein